MKYFFFDIDGTLVPFGADQPVQSAAEAIHTLREQGNKCFISTGRGYYLRRGVEKIENDGYIFCNGAGVVLDGKIVLQRTMNEKIIELIIRKAQETGVAIRLVCLNEYYENEAMHRHGQAFINRMKGEEKAHMQRICHSVEDYQGEPVYKVECWYPEDSDARDFVFAIAGKVNMISMNSMDANRTDGAEVTALDVSKGTAVLLVVTHFHGNIEDSYGFGDSMNDMELIKTAGHGIAMGNAIDDLKESSEYVTANVDDDGILKALQHYGIL
jgi:Cof subfamily protein (haloacid dehalogenase superfamily)